MTLQAMSQGPMPQGTMPQSASQTAMQWAATPQAATPHAATSQATMPQAITPQATGCNTGHEDTSRGDNVSHGLDEEDSGHGLAQCRHSAGRFHWVRPESRPW